MLRTAVRSTTRRLVPLRQPNVVPTSRRLLTSASAPKRGTWTGTALRWGAAIGVIYWYNTSPIFADEAPPQTIPHLPGVDDRDVEHKIEDILVEKRLLEAESAQAKQRDSSIESTEASSTPTAASSATAASAEALEDEAESQGAFDPETGEINWDCPCLGGMAHGPCGEQFKAAFSCFVYSKEEPKGMDCIDKFQLMQDCFRNYPEIYGAELADDEDGGASGDSPAAATAVDADGDATPPLEDKKPESAPKNVSEEPAKVEIVENTRAKSEKAPPVEEAGKEQKKPSNDA